MNGSLTVTMAIKQCRYQKMVNQITRTEVLGTMTADQIKLSDELKKLFPTYVNSIGFKKSDGSTLTLDENSNGTFKDYVK